MLTAAAICERESALTSVWFDLQHHVRLGQRKHVAMCFVVKVHALFCW